MEFYQNGGIFMHTVTLTLVGALVSLAIHITTRARSPRHLDLAAGLVRAGALFGALGTVMGLIETGMALSTIGDLAVWPRALARALPIALYPTAWALLCASPVVAALCVLRFRHARVRESLAPRDGHARLAGNLHATAP
ncbi:MAG: MotA/TolQ/ExbB proton channel family protein [Myxococcales bacterium]|nr:MotA/TolQ/ExbB proton channel family protein [Myxococcales bacterium]